MPGTGFDSTSQDGGADPDGGGAAGCGCPDIAAGAGLSAAAADAGPRIGRRRLVGGAAALLAAGAAGMVRATGADAAGSGAPAARAGRAGRVRTAEAAQAGVDASDVVSVATTAEPTPSQPVGRYQRTPIPAPTGRPVVFYAPHPDDEVLTMGISIANHVAAARTVHVVALSHGRRSSALNKINGTEYSTWWRGMHVPEIEGYAPLSDTDFGLARAAEFRSACGLLGVAPERVHVYDTEVSVDEAGEVIREFATNLPDAEHYTLSTVDDQAQHRAAADALWRLAREGTVGQAGWLVYRPYWNRLLRTRGWSYLRPTSTAQLQRVLDACNAYEAWNPAAGSYAVGGHSVWEGFDALRSDPRAVVQHTLQRRR